MKYDTCSSETIILPYKITHTGTQEIIKKFMYDTSSSSIFMSYIRRHACL